MILSHICSHRACRTFCAIRSASPRASMFPLPHIRTTRTRGFTVSLAPLPPGEDSDPDFTTHTSRCFATRSLMAAAGEGTWLLLLLGIDTIGSTLSMVIRAIPAPLPTNSAPGLWLYINDRRDSSESSPRRALASVSITAERMASISTTDVDIRRAGTACPPTAASSSVARDDVLAMEMSSGTYAVPAWTVNRREGLNKEEEDGVVVRATLSGFKKCSRRF
mmetsp:Transcript_12687/g.20723  ORF Transcript_12687/g.20723 Transcript_12687/m.20723 type:complete len:221 (+) Transcript_12687:370-1032(+)